VPTDRSVGLLVGRTHLLGTAVSLVGGDPRVPMFWKYALEPTGFDPLVGSDGFDPLWCKSPNGPQML
jgi:hypothetical protein